ncbi:MAG TPA: glycosyltransferase, partial [Rhodothermales bacterium]
MAESTNGQIVSTDAAPHVALFLPYLASGGAEHVMLHIARGLADEGFRVDLVLAEAKGPRLKHVSPKVRVVDLKARRVIRSLPGLVRYLRSERPTALVSALAHANLVALWANEIARTHTRIIVTVHSTLSLSTRFSPRKRDRLVPWLTHWSYKRAHRVVAVSTGSAKDLVRIADLNPEIVEVIPNPVITKELFEVSRMPVDHSWFGDRSTPLLLTVGRLTAAKNYMLLLDAFREARARQPMKLVFLGDGEERVALESKVRALDLGDDVSMPGFVDNPWAYMAKADMFVLSSKWEGLPTVLVEALALDMKVVSTDCEFGPRELLKDGKLGWLCPAGDAHSLATAILQALREEKRTVSKEDLEAFNLEVAVRRYKALLTGT